MLKAIRSLWLLQRRIVNGKGWHQMLGDPTTMRRVNAQGQFEYRPMTPEEAEEAAYWQAIK